MLEDKAYCVQTEISQLVVGLRPDFGPINGYLAAAWTQDAGNHAERRGLTAARGTDDEQHLAKVGDKRDPIYGRNLGVAFAKPVCQAGCDNGFFSFYRLLAGDVHKDISDGIFTGTSIL